MRTIRTKVYKFNELSETAQGGGSNVDAAFAVEYFLQDVADTLNNWLFRSLEKEYEYLTSEDAIKESIIANKYEFTKDGNHF